MSTQNPEDPVTRSLRSIITEVNDLSESFKAGHKWNCKDPYNHLHPHRGAIMAARNGRRLVRQAATTSSETQPPEEDLKVRIHPSSPEGPSSAFLLRPVSRGSNASSSVLLSPGGGGEDKKRLLLGELQPRHASTTRSMEYFPPKSKVRLSSSSANRRQLLKKQRTSDSAPPSKYYSGSSTYLFRQSSSASGNATLVPPPHYPQLSPSTSASHGITLVRGASCSLVDIPTYLGPSAGVELAQSVVRTTKGSASNRGDGIIEKKPISAPRPRLQLDLTKKQRSLSTGPSKKKSASGKKTQWTVLCVSLTLLTMCVTLVGTMLSVGSQYPEMLIARRWDQLLNESRMFDEEDELSGAINHTLSLLLPANNESTLLSEFLPSSFDNSTSNNYGDSSIILSTLLQNKSLVEGLTEDLLP